ncbi:UNVERIFIED_ORG: hypothetical protein ABIB52_002695 [Arthrobacter sp. UYCu721]
MNGKGAVAVAPPRKSATPQSPRTDSKLSTTTPTTGAGSLPERRSHPLLIRQWKKLWREEFVELRRGPKTAGTGWIDDITADGTTIWIHLCSGNGRVMIHQDDGIDIWRVDSRISQDRPQT